VKSLRIALFLLPFLAGTASAEVITIDSQKAEVICKDFDSMLYNAFSGWSDCRKEVTGLKIQADLVDWLIRLRAAGANANEIRESYLQANGGQYDTAALDYLSSVPRFLHTHSVPEVLKSMKNGKYDIEALKFVVTERPGMPMVAADLMKIMKDGKYDLEAIQFLLHHKFIVGVMLGDMLEITKNGKYDLDLLKLCNSTSMLNPVMSSRTLSQPAILNCVRIVKNVESTLVVKALIAPCRLKMDIVDRNACLEPALVKQKVTK